MWAIERSPLWCCLLLGCVTSPTTDGTTAIQALPLPEPFLDSSESFGSGLAFWERMLLYSDPEDYLEYEWRPNGAVTGSNLEIRRSVQFLVPDAMAEDDVGFGWTLEALGDVTGDGREDLAITYRDLGRIELAPEQEPDPDLTESQGGRFRSFVITPSGGRDRVAACGDLDGAGGDDLCTTAGVWAGPVGGAPPPVVSWDPADALVGLDLLGDGVRDLVVADGATVYWLPAPMATPGHHALSDLADGTWEVGGPVTALAAGDFDGDGADELAVGTATALVVGRFDAAGAWTEVAAAPLPVDTLAVGDLDADGSRDLAVGGGGEVSWFSGPLDAAQPPVRTWRGPGWPDDFVGRSLAAGDTDGDGTWELAIGSPNPDPGGPSALWWVEEP